MEFYAMIYVLKFKLSNLDFLFITGQLRRARINLRLVLAWGHLILYHSRLIKNFTQSVTDNENPGSPRTSFQEKRLIIGVSVAQAVRLSD